MPCTCSDLLTDSSNCGVCGNRCPVGTDCVQGACLQTCTLDFDCPSGTEFCCLQGVDSQGCSPFGHCSPKLPDGVACSRSTACSGGCCCLSINCLPGDNGQCSLIVLGPSCSGRNNNLCKCL
jgi:hypothetical protein